MEITIEQFLRSKVSNFDISEDALAVFAASPLDINLEPFDLQDLAFGSGDEFIKRRDYVESCLWYSISGLMGTSGTSEKIGDSSYSSGSIVLSKDDRARFKANGDALRDKWKLSKVKTISATISGANKYVGLIR